MMNETTICWNAAAFASNVKGRLLYISTCYKVGFDAENQEVCLNLPKHWVIKLVELVYLPALIQYNLQKHKLFSYPP